MAAVALSPFMRGEGRRPIRNDRNRQSHPMTIIHPAAHERDLLRGMRPDAHRYIRPDWRRDVRPGSELWQLYERVERKYSPNHPRVPAGSSEGGRWTGGDGGGGGGGTNDHRVLSDASPDAIRPGAQYAQNRTRGPGRGVSINGQQVEPTPGQAARLAVVEAQARDAVRRVQELDPNWRPTPSAYESVEGLIASYRGDAEQAQARILELQNKGIGPGLFAAESIPARGPQRDFMADERRGINNIGSATGCHTCGTRVPGTTTGNFVADHQPPSALNLKNHQQRLYPQCLTCSLKQGGWISGRGSAK